MRPAATLTHPRAFWTGAAMVVAGVLLHLPMFLGARARHYVLRGMAWDAPMVVGMALIGLGLALVVLALAPRSGRAARRPGSGLETRALDEGKLGAGQVKLIGVLIAAIAIDTLKPFTFTFILPGVAREYHLASPGHPSAGHWPVALLPFAGIVGTVIGSFLWGYLGDRIGRRVSILIAAVVFIATSACGAMPTFGLNMVMCFVMGLGAGGLLPIAYSLLVETVPARRRGQVVVLVAGIGTAIGFLLTSWLANWLIPSLGWRVMWFVGLPTGLVLVLLNRHIPESPRFLLANGRREEALAVMSAFGVTLRASPTPAPARPTMKPRRWPLVRAPFTTITLALGLYGLGWGVVNFGFIVWLPTTLSHRGLGVGDVEGLLAQASLFSIPGSVLVAWLYARWSAKRTMVVFAGLTAASLIGFAAWGPELAHNTALLTVLVVVLLVSLWGVISVLAPYSAEVYPTAIRAAGTGLAAALSKCGGVLALGMSVIAVAPPSLAGSALLSAVPIALAAVVIGVAGVETRGRRLEEIAPRSRRGSTP